MSTVVLENTAFGGSQIARMQYNVCMGKQAEFRHERLLEQIKKRGLSLEQLSQRSGVSKPQISLLQHGKRGANAAAALANLAIALHCSSDYLLDLTDDPTPSREELPAHYREFFSLLDTLEEYQQWQLFQMARLIGGRIDELFVAVANAYHSSRQAQERRVRDVADIDNKLSSAEALALGDVTAMFRLLRARGFRREHLTQEIEEVYSE